MREHLLQIENDFLASSEVRSHMNIARIDALAMDIKDKRKSQFDQSLKFAKLVKASYDWFKSEDGQNTFNDNGLTWTNEDFYTKAICVSKAHFYRVIKVAKICEENPQIVTKYKRDCTAEENAGNPTERSVAELIKRANGTSTSQDENESPTETLVTFSMKKTMFEDGRGLSIRILSDGEIKTNGDAHGKISDAMIEQLKAISEAIINSNNN
jgi:hypothetical protein